MDASCEQTAPPNQICADDASYNQGPSLNQDCAGVNNSDGQKVLPNQKCTGDGSRRHRELRDQNTADELPFQRASPKQNFPNNNSCEEPVLVDHNYAGNDSCGQSVPQNQTGAGSDLFPFCRHIPRPPLWYCISTGCINYLCFCDKDGRREHTSFTKAISYKSPCVWATCKRGKIPVDAVPGGDDTVGAITYVGRAVHESNVILGKVLTILAYCYVGQDKVEHKYWDYQALVSDGARLEWQAATDGAVLKRAIQGGMTSDREPLYVARALYKGMKTAGRLQPSQRCAIVTYGGVEHRYTDYEVLVCKTVNFSEAHTSSSATVALNPT